MAAPRPQFGRLMTAEELFARYSTRDGKHELARGRLIVAESVGGLHGDAATRLACALHAHVQRHDPPGRVLIETGFVLGRHPDTVRGPDVSFVREARVPAGHAFSRFLDGAPDLAAEILSPDDRWPDVEAKIADYFAAGTRLVWIIDPLRRRVMVRTPDAPPRALAPDDVLDGAPVLPGLSLSISLLFD